MAKIKLNYVLKHEREENVLKTMGIKKDNVLVFKDHDITFKMILNNQLSFERKSKDYKVQMTFEKDKITKGIYQVYSLGFFDLKVKTIFLKQIENHLHLKYELMINNENNGVFELKLNYEVIE